MTDNCKQPACSGQIVEGFCDHCGVEGKPAQEGSAKAPSTLLSGRDSRTGTHGRTRRSSSYTRVSSGSRHLGLGLVSVPEVPKVDPVNYLMKEAKVPENKRFCSGQKADGHNCENPLTKREKGFCNVCGTPYDFQPKLGKGDMVAGQYEVAGCIAFGGMGWIYLAKDVTLNRYVVLKGLVNSSDKNLAAAAVAERQFLAEVKHGNIVSVYTCVSDSRSVGGKTENHAYTVMEFVGGRTLKSLRKERGPLPVAEVLAYMHPVLAAFAYMHGNKLIYNDFKPDNVMLEDGDIKVIDLGGVSRLNDPDADIYSTLGYAAPELAKDGPSPASDVYTIGRTIAVLVTEFKGFQSSHQFKLRSPAEEPVFAKYESLYRFLRKACHDNPSMRFQSAEEMQEQLVGLMKEVVAMDGGPIRPSESRYFGADTLGMRNLDGAAAGVHTVDIHCLPPLKLNPNDPATSFIFNNLGAADPKQQTAVLEAALSQHPDSLEAKLVLAKNQIILRAYDLAESYLQKVEEADAFDWRVIWYRGMSLMAQGRMQEAVQAFDTCYSEVPGELAPKLAIALAAELCGLQGLCQSMYGIVSNTDPSFATAVFGLARSRLKSGERHKAAQALSLVPPTSSLFNEAQKALSRVLIDRASGDPGVNELSQAASTVEALVLEGREKFVLVREILESALSLLESGKIQAEKSVSLLGHTLDRHDLRLGLEASFRQLARLTSDKSEKIALIDMANAARPRTLF